MMKRLPGMPMPANQVAAMRAKQRAAAPTAVPVPHVADMMQGPMHAYLGRFQAGNVLRAGHNATQWIQGAIRRPGAFTRKAKAAGMGTQAYARKVTQAGSQASTRTKRQANLAKTLAKLHR